jgi:hypothetical protein
MRGVYLACSCHRGIIRGAARRRHGSAEPRRRHQSSTLVSTTVSMQNGFLAPLRLHRKKPRRVWRPIPQV